jgi:flagellar protein FlbT
VVLNDVPVLREKDILKEDKADTPCKRIYLSIQLMYMDMPNLAAYHQHYWEQVRPVIEAAPSMTPLIGKISDEILAGHYYQALRVARELIQYEQELLNNACKPT